jgi:hypothetical protein
MKKLLLAVLLLPALALSGCDTTDDELPPLATVDDDGNTTINLQNLQATLETITPGELSEQEIDGLMYMREEEKLAHDVYVVLYDVWGQRVFDNISNSEQTHTEAVLELINRYALTDPAAGNEIGVFTDTTLQSLNDTLVASGSSSLIDALMVGAAIEEIDMIDINRYIDQVEDNDDIVLVYENLLKGSRNHLRAFVSNLENQGVTYQPQYMDADEYQQIIDSPMERG